MQCETLRGRDVGGAVPYKIRCHRFRVLAVFIFNFQVAFGV